MTASKREAADGGRRLHLNAFLMSTGHHEASWRLPETDSFAGTQLAHFQQLARTAERGTFDSIFFADSPVLHGDVRQRPYGTYCEVSTSSTRTVCFTGSTSKLSQRPPAHAPPPQTRIASHEKRHSPRLGSHRHGFGSPSQLRPS